MADQDEKLASGHFFPGSRKIFTKRQSNLHASKAAIDGFLILAISSRVVTFTARKTSLSFSLCWDALYRVGASVTFGGGMVFLPRLWFLWPGDFFDRDTGLRSYSLVPRERFFWRS